MKVGKIEDKNKRMVNHFSLTTYGYSSKATFRKRRDGLFKKALEIHLLTGADVYLTVVNCDKQYRLNRLSGAAANPHLTVMDYSSQGSFQVRKLMKLVYFIVPHVQCFMNLLK